MQSKLVEFLHEISRHLAYWFVTYKRIAGFMGFCVFGCLLLVNLLLFDGYGGLLFPVKSRGNMQTGLDLWASYVKYSTLDRKEQEEQIAVWREAFQPFIDLSSQYAIWDADAVQSAGRAGWMIASPRPENGQLFGDTTLPHYERIAIDATRMATDVQLVLLKRNRPTDPAIYYPERVLSIVAHAGHKVDTRVPAGQYNVIIVTGLLWSGDEYGFFPGGYGRLVQLSVKFGGTQDHLIETESGYKIEKRERRYRGYSFTLRPYRDGSPGFREVRMKRIKAR